jgi:RNA polymerase sigma-70 factor (ECF subfamily)
MSDPRDRLAAVPADEDSFDAVVLPHLDAAYRLARWLVRNEHDAEDVVQEASLRAFRYFRTFTGGSARAWFLRIVRNTCYGRRGGGLPFNDQFDEERHRGDRPSLDPEALLLQTDVASLVERAMCRLPRRFHELLVLRELQGLSYQEVAEALGVPRGTVMSGLSRARHAFRGALKDELQGAGTASPQHPREQGHERPNRRSVPYPEPVRVGCESRTTAVCGR